MTRTIQRLTSARNTKWTDCGLTESPLGRKRYTWMRGPFKVTSRDKLHFHCWVMRAGFWQTMKLGFDSLKDAKECCEKRM